MKKKTYPDVNVTTFPKRSRLSKIYGISENMEHVNDIKDGCNQCLNCIEKFRELLRSF
jgi:hypothetical protein